VTTCLSVEGLAKTYRGNWLIDSTVALRDVTFSIQPGERVGLLGTNGAGKTTTFKAIAGLIRPTRGRVTLFGHPPQRREAREGLGYLPESPYFHDFLTGQECVDLAARLCGVRAAERAALVSQVLDRVGLMAARTRHLRTYSKGMLQRVGVAQAIVSRPRLIILDEPMTGLDPIGRREVRDLIGSLAGDGAAVVFSTHIISDVELACDRVVMIASGRVVRDGTLAQLLAGRQAAVDVTVRDLDTDTARRAAEPLAVTLLGTGSAGVVMRVANADAAEDLRGRLVRAGGRVVAVVPQSGTLEDLFLEQVAAAGEAPP
jgi:ABC-2 type transport system ATP-binding protein